MSEGVSAGERGSSRADLLEVLIAAAYGGRDVHVGRGFETDRDVRRWPNAAHTANAAPQIHAEAYLNVDAFLNGHAGLSPRRPLRQRHGRTPGVRSAGHSLGRRSAGG